MTLVNTEESPTIADARSKFGVLGLFVRGLLPIGLIAIGGVAFWLLSKEIEQELPPAEEKQAIRTRVSTLQVQDYVVTIRKNGIVQAHNEVALSTEVSGQVVSISPEFQVGAYFTEGDVLVELDARDYVNALEIAKAQRLGAK